MCSLVLSVRTKLSQSFTPGICSSQLIVAAKDLCGETAPCAGGTLPHHYIALPHHVRGDRATCRTEPSRTTSGTRGQSALAPRQEHLRITTTPSPTHSSKSGSRIICTDKAGKNGGATSRFVMKCQFANAAVPDERSDS